MTDSPSMATPDVDRLIGEVDGSAARLAATLSGLTEAACRAPSALAPWTRGQVLAHIAGGADAYVWLLRLARTGSAPGPRQDAAALAETAERTAALPVDALADRTRRALDLVVAEAREMPAARWDVLVAALAGWRHPAWYTLLRCLRELEHHHVDLGLGYGTLDWPTSYVSWALDETLTTLRAQGHPVARVEAVDLGRHWAPAPEGPSIAGPGHLLLGWLSGRTPAAGLVSDRPTETLPPLPRWPQPPSPGWGRTDDVLGLA
ncbi:maleylpyruvate isomerase family mycothiol-dependent enzyme [Streptomyces diastatochromogenes]|uniref:maleylpyruvate isomerase family mycothiol-dependent enzyme n=1 Tax=Streptomyces diastatochromogenes TaxID=42236 RepID=UPI00368571CF